MDIFAELTNMLIEMINEYTKNELTSKIVITIGTIFLAWLIGYFVTRSGRKAKDLNPDDNDVEDLIPFVTNMIKAGIYVIAGLMILSFWGVNIGPLLAGAGIAGAAIAFASKDIISNLFGGVQILTDKPYKVGDYIILEGVHRGIVEYIGARSTKIKTIENVMVTIPNSLMVTNPIYNETGNNPELKVKVEVGVAYGSDLEQVEEILLDVAANNDNVFDAPKPIVRFTQFGESSVDVVLIGTIADPSVIGLVKHELIKEVYLSLNEAGIEIPYPQRDVHLYQNNQN